MKKTLTNRLLRVQTAGAVLQTLESRLLLAATLAADINLGTAPSMPSSGVKIGSGNEIVFAAGTQVWKSDGTSPGTVPLGSSFGSDQSIQFIAANGVAYFSITPLGNTYSQLWRSDGTAAGTELLFADAAAYVGAPANSNGTLYFTVSGGSRRELWKSDGSAAGTSKVYTFSGYAQVGSSGFTHYNGRTYFATDSGTLGSELWSTNGTEAGTGPLLDIYVGSAASSPRQMTVSNGLLYFTASSANSGEEPWRTDGTPAGTYKLAEISSGSSSSYPENFVTLDATTTLFLGNGYLYRTTGAAGSTTRINTTSTTDLPYSFDNLTRVGNNIFFSAYQSSPGNELWKTDGTPAGTIRVKDINVSGLSNPQDFNVIGSTLYFRAVDNTFGQQLWKSDGTAAGTTRIVRYDNSPDGYNLSRFTATNTKLFYAYSDPIIGRELYATDGVTAGLVKDLDTTPISSLPKWGASVNGKYLVAARGANQLEAWWSVDPSTGVATNTGATNVPAVFNGNRVKTLPFKDGLIYTRDTSGIYFTDGTAAGTQQLTSAQAGNSYEPRFTAVGNRIFFTAYFGGSYATMHVSDGTTAGTVNLLPSTPLLNVSGIASAGNFTYFVAQRDRVTTSQELWRTDGTAAGTTSILTLPAGSYTEAGNLASLNGKLTYTHQLLVGSTIHTYLDQYDPATGTVALLHDFVGFTDSFYKPTVIGDRLFFAGDAYSTTTRGEVWVSDGTPAGTKLIEDLQPEYYAFTPEIIGVYDERLLFAANDAGTGSAGRQLWITDGTEAGTSKLSGLLTSIGTLYENSQTTGSTAVVNGQFFFAATDAANGRELWRTDGTPAGTQRVTDINPGTLDAKPDALAGAGGTLYFAATATNAQGETDREIWKLADTFAPVVRLATLDLHASGPRIVVRFNETIDSTSFFDAIHVTNRSTGLGVNGIVFDSFDAATNTALYRFVGTPADGDYRVTVRASATKDAAGNFLAADVTGDFFIMAGDINRDRSVDFADLVILAQNYGRTGMTFGQGNLNYSSDGLVGFDDLVVLAQRYNATLAPLSAMTIALPAATTTKKSASRVAKDVIR